MNDVCQIGGRKGGTAVYGAEAIEFCAAQCVRWTCNNVGLGSVKGRTAEVTEVRDGRVTLRLEDSRSLALASTHGSAISTSLGPRPCMRFRATPSTT